MRKCYIVLILLLLGQSIAAQVGINTQNPKSSLHVQKRTELTFADGIIPPRISGDSLRLKDAAYGLAQNGAIVFVTSPVTTGSIKTQDVLSKGFFVYDANYTHPGNQLGVWNRVTTSDVGAASSTYAARATGNLQLLSLGLNLLGSAVRTIPLLGTSSGGFTVEIPSVQVNNNVYTVPSDGIYHINYSFRTGQGIRAELLGANRPGLIITKTAVGTTTPTALDYRLFGGLQLLDLGALGLINVSLTQGQISHIYNLRAGDVLRFGVVEGGLSLGVLTDASAELSIYKIR